jgi:3-hydroxyisobutyrate dehydrogenase-like beta-hydroxyacid dehydrogenase
MKNKVGFIGLGQMGKRMAVNIQKKGFPLWVYDLRQAAVDELGKHGANAVQSLSELGKRCNRIIFSLPDASVVEHVLFGDKGLKNCLEQGDIIIDCGTTHPLFTEKTSAILKEKGIDFIDAPVSGTDSRAQEGTLTIMVGGNEHAYQTIYPLLEAMGRTIVYLGSSGKGQLAKTINNVLYNISCAAMAEILPMAVKLGLDSEKICSVVRTGTGQSYGFDAFSALVLEGNFKPGYPMRSAYKDMATIMELSNKNRIPLPVTTATMQTYQMALAQGLGSENKGAMIKVWEKIFGVEARKTNQEGESE